MNIIEIRNTLNQKYERNTFKNLLYSIFEKSNYFKSPIKIQTDNDKVLEFLQLGVINLHDNKMLSIFELKLRKDINIYRNKVELRNLTMKYIDQVSNHGVLVVFDNQSNNYRFTFATKYSEFDDSGKIKTVETEHRRFSYLLGSDESCRTASEQFEKLKNKRNSLFLQDIISAFNVDKVSDDFYNTYKNIYLELYDEVEILSKKDKKINSTFSSNNITIEGFSKKILSQIIFLYFLQKKGWLGINKNTNGKFKTWGEGSKKFIEDLFYKKYTDYTNFFNDVLEPLFIAFSSDLVDNYYKPLDCKIPFLNGGLFDPLKNYNWSETNINISNKFFQNLIGQFSRYNFTVNEEDEFDKEVAIDPEMLGKVFENLLTIKDRKSKGTFYTPRKIVKYITRKAISDFLKSKLKLCNLDDEFFIKLINHNYMDINHLQNYATKIDTYLANIKICDPAIGSGAFSIEIMNQIVSLRMLMNDYINKEKRTSYYFKRKFIENSLYGNDIDMSAIETAKLRLWLSLVIDEEDYNKVTTLPNLDFKIIEGDSLSNVSKNLFNQHLFKKLNILKKDFFSLTNLEKKKSVKIQIKGLIKEIAGNSNFDYKVYFSEVFDNNEGFDIIISNPPYVQIQNFNDKEYKDMLKQNYTDTYHGNGDIYCLFFERSFNLLNANGSLIFITSNKWLKTDYGKLLRNYLIRTGKLETIIDFKSLKIFKSADVDTCITSINKNKDLFSPVSCLAFTKSNDNNFQKTTIEEIFNKNKVRIEKLPLNEPWTIARQEVLKLLSKISDLSNRLALERNNFRMGIKTGLNKVFIIDKTTKENLENKNKKNLELLKPVIAGKNLNKFNINWDSEWILFTKRGTDINKYTDVKNYLDKNREILEPKKNITDKKGRKKGNYKWFEIQDETAYYPLFENDKIAWMNMNRGWKFAFVPKGYYIEASCNFYSSNSWSKYLLGIFSSDLHLWYFRQKGRMFDDGGYMCKVDTIFNFPVPKPSSLQKGLIVNLVEHIISDNKNSAVVKNLNEEIYNLYKLSQPEITLIKDELKILKR